MNLAKYQSLAEQLSTVRDFFRFTLTSMQQKQLFYGHGTDTAWDDALALVFDTLQLPHDAQKLFLDARLVDAEKSILLERIYQRIEEYKPVPYLTHIAWYANFAFYVDERVIIPRSPIAELIERRFSPWLEISAESSILDLCTGSACIAITCAHYFPETSIDAIDISPEALAVAQINVDKHQVGEQVNLIQSDLFSAVSDKKYDLIISNPPYVDAQDMYELPHEFRHEPELALASGHDGLEATKTILQQASRYLHDDGILIVEVGNSQAALTSAYPDVPFMWLEFERGGHGVFLLTKSQLVHFLELFD
ncbi:MAG: 50S ribosomal protein L3 N(5)-glutamine methyltransferase [Legionellales bacterium]|nr:50S ribosomal protein L3 N(5)-glutamine methyltransferase [Legionellales bacterium]|tara:strand:+ start:520 stop:1443 length:924 start_codon:yes stop_codon:yes gene_type:complete